MILGVWRIRLVGVNFQKDEGRGWAKGWKERRERGREEGQQERRKAGRQANTKLEVVFFPWQSNQMTERCFQCDA